MRRILNFLFRIRIFLIFIALEVIAFTWIHRSRSYQRAVFYNSANAVSGGLLETENELERYFDLEEQNERLAQENARLRSVMEGAYFPLAVRRGDSLDSLRRIRFSYLEGEIVSSSFQKKRNYMTIDRGAAHGVKSGAGVLGSRGIIGVTRDVGKHFSTVIPVISPIFSVSGRLKNSDFFGPVIWKDDDYQFAYLTDIPRYAKIAEGDTVETDSRSLAFPAGAPIGIVESYEMQEDQNFLELKLRLATDFASVRHIYIVQDLMKMELDSLQQNTQIQ